MAENKKKDDRIDLSVSKADRMRQRLQTLLYLVIIFGSIALIVLFANFVLEPLMLYHSAGEFAERLDLSPGRVANVLKALEKKGLIERKKDPSDGRRTMVTLTQKGREYICQTYTQAIDVYHNLIEEIGEHDTREFLRITKKLLEASRVLK